MFRADDRHPDFALTLQGSLTVASGPLWMDSYE